MMKYQTFTNSSLDELVRRVDDFERDKVIVNISYMNIEYSDRVEFGVLIIYKEEGLI